MRPATRRLLFVGWTTLASLLLLEGVLQLGALFARPEASPPDASAPAPHSDAYTVLAVGDSWVAGAEANPGEGFVDRLATSLPQSLSRDVRVVNRGRSGANSAHVALTVWDEAEAQGADLILVLVGQNNSTNFARVAEVEERLGAAASQADRPSTGPQFELRSWKLARLLWVNLRGTEGYTEQIAGPQAPALPDIPAMTFDVEGRSLVTDPLLLGPDGRAFLEGLPPSEADDSDEGWAALRSAEERRPIALEPLGALRQAAKRPENVLARYALLRAAREREDWTAVNRHGAALAELRPRTPLTDLGAAESALLRGDWRRARALLVSAAHGAPGFAHVRDLACRFPREAADARVQEACEFEPLGGGALAEARTAEGTLDPEGAAAARERWLVDHPWDLASQVDLALWHAHTGDLKRADEIMGRSTEQEGPLPPPVRPDAEHWRYYVLRNAELGEEAIALHAVEAALTELETAAPYAPLLGALVTVLAEYRRCDLLPDVAERWYRVRGDAVGPARALGVCLDPPDVARRLGALRSAWDPSPAPTSFEALSRAGNHPLALLERDLDLVLAEARRVDARVLLLDYPNPSDDHAALATLVEDYSTSRAVPRVALRDAFAARLDHETWQEHLGPNGHCNARGYALMAEFVTDAIARLPKDTSP
ncbi:MAG: SGNH/GDSL hydrolase family protein [Deltaproteobacteria bacterium]|nr:SGNH/GDSL hydrolase family protein [Deltaproteobacteria bacterium]